MSNEIKFYKTASDNPQRKIGSWKDEEGTTWYGYFMCSRKDKGKAPLELFRSKYLQALVKFETFLAMASLVPDSIEGMLEGISQTKVMMDTFSDPELNTEAILGANSEYLSGYFKEELSDEDLRTSGRSTKPPRVSTPASN